MKLFEILEKDHHEIAAYLNEISDTTESAIESREKTLHKLKEKLQQHTQVKEEFFYPELINCDDTKDLILEAYEEHNVIDQLLDQLVKVPVVDKEWAAKFTILKDIIEHHVAEEERELFPKVKKILSKETMDQIAEKIEIYRQQNP